MKKTLVAAVIALTSFNASAGFTDYLNDFYEGTWFVEAKEAVVVQTTCGRFVLDDEEIAAYNESNGYWE